MGAYERRMEIIERLCERRFDTISNLSYEFNVSSLHRSHEPCEEATIYNEKYWKLVEDYKAKFNKK